MRPRIDSWRQATIQTIRSPDAVLPIIAVNSLLWRSSPEIIHDFLPAIVARISMIRPEILSWLGKWEILNNIMLGLGFGWLLFLSLTYITIPYLLRLSNPTTNVFNRPALRLLMVVLVTGFSYQILSMVAPEHLVPTRPLDSVAFVGFVGTGWIITGTFIYLRWWYQGHISRRIDLIESFSWGTVDTAGREQLHDGLTRTDWVKAVTTLIGIGRSSAFVLGVCFIYGLMVGVAIWLFPLPELIILIWGIVSVFRIKSPKKGWQQALRSSRDGREFIDSWFRSLLQYSTSSWQGATVIFFIGLGYLISAAFLLISGLGLFSFIWVVGQNVKYPGLVTTLPIQVWNVLGVTLCLIIPGLYSQWFWMSITFRLPYILTSRGDENQNIKDGSKKTLPQLVRRPRYNLIPPSLLWFPIIVSIALIGDSGVLTLGNPLFAIGWPIPVAGTLWTGYWTLQSEPLPVRTDEKAMQAAFVLQLAWSYGLHLLMPNTIPFSLNIAASITLAILLLYNGPAIGRYLSRRIGRA